MVSPSPTTNDGRAPVINKRYELLTFGDELLLGLTTNTHLSFLGSQLGRRGVLLQRNVTITDAGTEALEDRVPDGASGQDLTSTQPFSSLAINAGIKISFGSR